MLPEKIVAPAPSISLRRRIYEMILDQQERWHSLPTQDDVRHTFGGQTDEVDLLLRQLECEGMLILDKDGGNGISLAPTYSMPPRPGLMNIVADLLSLADANEFRGSIGMDLRGSGLPVERGVRVVQVLDDRMSDAHIVRGDLAILVNSQPMKGSIVGIERADVVVLRRYVVISGIPHFLAENQNSPELIPAWNASLCGVLWGLIRVDQSLSSQSVTPIRSADLPPNNRRKMRSRKPLSSGKSTQGRMRRMTAHPIPQESATAALNLRRSEWPKPPSGFELNEPTTKFSEP